ncbi:MAG TPA: hypothetical protein VFK22_05890 [Candidatus Dormibacteraeota bacterium]|nr:hypothetical protein [Candidatus Dormibacteraeota bacterium]
MSTFVRVAHRRGWEVEVISGTKLVESSIHSTRKEALDRAMSLAPDWIEVGDIVALDTEDQHHEWTTLRREADGSYSPSALKWQRRQSG